MGRLDGKVAIITGASYGMGEAAARLFAKEGAKVVAVARSRDRLETVVKEIVDEGFSAYSMVADISVESNWEDIIVSTIATYGKIDILINNAGVCFMDATVEACTAEQWQKTLDINMNAVWYGMRAVVPHMRAVGGGSIVNCASVASMLGGSAACADSIPYSASKGAVRAMTKNAAISLAPDNIRVNSVHPGGIYTHMVEVAGVPSREAMGQWHVNNMPLPPHAGEAIDIAYAYLYLASDESKFVTGIELPVDGGWLAK